MRKLKFHEQKLMKKVNFLEWKRDKGHREAFAMLRLHVMSEMITKKYSGICLMVHKLMNILRQMEPKYPFRIERTDSLLEKLYNMGVISTRKSLA